jgi:hypothetical protein
VEEAHATLEHMLYCINIDEVLEDVKECLNDKNPSLKIHTLSWIDKFLMKNKDGSVWKISSIDLDEETLVLSKYKTNGWHRKIFISRHHRRPSSFS